MYSYGYPTIYVDDSIPLRASTADVYCSARETQISSLLSLRHQINAQTSHQLRPESLPLCYCSLGSPINTLAREIKVNKTEIPYEAADRFSASA